MSKSQRLRLGEVRTLFRLVGECRELGDDAEAWRGHLAAGLCCLTEAQLALVGEARVVGPERLMVPIQFADHGWPNPVGRAFYLAWPKDPAALNSPFLQSFHSVPGRFVTRTRQELTGDRDWYTSAFVNEVLRPSGLDDALLSQYAPPGRDWQHELVLNRLLGDPPFGRRECLLVHLCQAEVVPLLGRALATSSEVGPAGLSPRLRQTLEALLEGDSEKQAALRLGVGVRTVHEYVLALYRHFEVSSRGELLAFFLRRFRHRPPAERFPLKNGGERQHPEGPGGR
jgi:DNA-binding CsgD family transcriptional regulator